MRVARVLAPAGRAVLVVVCLTAGAPLFAQEPAAATVPPATIAHVSMPLWMDAGAAPAQQPAWREAPPPRRPAALLPLYGSLIALQALDLHSTRLAMAGGTAREANPALAPVVRNDAAFFAVKAASTAGMIWASERMWKRHPKTAVALAALVNTAMAAVVANNYRVKR